MDSFEGTKIKSNHQLCRICVCEESDLKSLFAPMEIEDIQEESVMTLADVFLRLTCETISSEDSLPYLICTKCAELMYSGYLFKIKYEKSHSLFQEYLRKETQTEEINYDDIVIKIDYEDIECNDIKEEILIINENEEVKRVESNNKKVKRAVARKKLKKETDKELQKLHPCPICTVEFPASELRRHARTHNSLKNYLSIPKQFTVNRGTKFYYIHDPNKAVISIHNQPVKIHRCPVCKVELPALELRRHLSTHQFETEYKCDQCGRIFRKINHLNTHKVKHLKECPFKCEQCGKGFVIQKNYECHVLTHKDADELPHECPHCLKRFSNPEHLNRHVIIHTENVSYAVKYKVCKCSNCLRAFKDKDELKEHKCVPLKRTYVQVFRCKLCDEVFKNSNVLYSHKRAVHCLTGVKALCTVCGQYSSNIYNHMKMHNDVKPFECNQCDKRFTTNRQLQQHLLVHSGLKPFICSVCGKAFNNIYNLQVHERIHKGDRCHICHVCGKGFLEKSYLKKHLNVHEKVE